MKRGDERLIRFHGFIEVDATHRLHCTVSIRFEPLDPTGIQVELMWHGDESDCRKAANIIGYWPRNHFVIHPSDPDSSRLELLGISSMTNVGRETSIRVAAIEYGLSEEILPESTEYHVFVRLQPSAILCFPSIHNQYSTGNVVIEKIDAGEIHFDTPFGTLQALEAYEYRGTEEFGNKVTQQVQRASLVGKLSFPAGTSLQSTYEWLEAEIDGVCTALSLAYRQPVGYYEIDLRKADRNLAGPTQALSRKRWNSVRRKRKGDELLHASNLSEGRFQLLLDRISGCQNPAVLRKAIDFLAASYEATVDAAYFMTFSAMETILTLCISDLDIGLERSVWKKLERALRDAVDGQAEPLGIDDGRARDIKQKLPELKRLSLNAKVQLACDRLQPKTDDLWPDKDFVEGIAQAASLRNDLFHEAGYDSPEMGENLIRLRTFTERLVLRFLDWPSDETWAWYDQDLKWLNASVKKR